jgi:hypothetical protein
MRASEEVPAVTVQLPWPNGQAIGLAAGQVLVSWNTEGGSLVVHLDSPVRVGGAHNFRADLNLTLSWLKQKVEELEGRQPRGRGPVMHG